MPHSMQNIARACRTSCTELRGGEVRTELNLNPASAWPGPARITEIFPDAGSTSTRSIRPLLRVQRRPHASLDGSTPDQAYFTPLPFRMAT